ncbi:hypothetical protein ACFXC8_00285 [Streptomyces sp. NPDC059441]|uniref:hypothetical protein n=1 Tax=Streptomyces sp. NPDC059441 TaxID=3346829 RepID=UPI0036750549
MTRPEQRTEWAIETGHEGRWHVTTAPYEDRAAAVDDLALKRLVMPSQEFRLLRIDTTTVRTIEEA